jgi:hypothetical protein
LFLFFYVLVGFGLNSTFLQIARDSESRKAKLRLAADRAAMTATTTLKTQKASFLFLLLVPSCSFRYNENTEHIEHERQSLSSIDHGALLSSVATADKSNQTE